MLAPWAWCMKSLTTFRSSHWLLANQSRTLFCWRICPWVSILGRSLKLLHANKNQISTLLKSRMEMQDWRIALVLNFKTTPLFWWIRGRRCLQDCTWQLCLVQLAFCQILWWLRACQAADRSWHGNLSNADTNATSYPLKHLWARSLATYGLCRSRYYWCCDFAWSHIPGDTKWESVICHTSKNFSSWWHKPIKDSDLNITTSHKSYA